MENQKITNLQVKIVGAQKKIEKLGNTINRHQNALAKKIAVAQKICGEQVAETINWENADRYMYQDTDKHDEWYWAICDVDDKVQAIKENEKKLEKAYQQLAELQAKYKSLKEEDDAIPLIPTVEEFLANWKADAFKWYMLRADQYREVKKEYYQKYEELRSKRNTFEKGEYAKAIKELDTWRYDQLKNFPTWLQTEVSYNSRKGFEEYLNKMLDKEVYEKRKDLIFRVSDVAGVIKDASHLTIRNGNINGYVVGDKGNALVETIGAGGYNIQCFHYRVLVKPMK